MPEVVPPSNLDPNAATWGRWVTGKITELISVVKRNTDNQANQNKQTNSSIKKLSQQIRAQPYVVTSGDTATGSGLNASYVTKNTVVVPIPAGKTIANVMVIVNAQYLDVSSGGSAVASGRVFIGPNATVGGSLGVFSQAVSAAKDAGASAVNNILNLGFSATLTGLDVDNISPNIYVTFQATATSGTAYGAQAANFSQVAVQVVFTN